MQGGAAHACPVEGSLELQVTSVTKHIILQNTAVMKQSWCFGFFFSYGAKKPGCRFASNLPWNEPFWKHTLGPRLTPGNRRTVFWAGLEIPCQQQHLTNFQLVMNDNGLNKNIAQKNVKMENVRAQKIKINSTVHWLQTWKKPKHQACRK